MKRLKILLICILAMLLISCNNNVKAPNPPLDNSGKIPEPDKMILDPQAWKEKHPLIYDSYMKTSTMEDNVKEDSDLGGSHPIDYIKKYPNIAILYEGIGFSKEYYQARGHFYALEDVTNISRPKPGASCISCKTAEFEKLYKENGEELYAMDFQKTIQDVKFGITCYNCHRNTPGEVQTTSIHFNDAVKKLDIEPSLGTQACAQCHVEYYFDKDSKKVLLPWANGVGIDEIESYYDDIDYSDWEHPRTGTPLIKVQHPEFEMYSGSLHDSIKVSCADCHMPTMTDNKVEYKSHWVTSPLKTPEESCGKCHSNQLEEIVLKVESIQKNTERKEVEVSDLLVKLTNDFAKAIEEKKLDDDKMNKLRELNRKAQYRWDFVFVENSTGFHNEQKSTKALDEAKSYAQEAIDILENLQ